MKFDWQENKFKNKGKTQGSNIYAGKNGQALMMGKKDKMPYAWVEKDEEWKSIGWSAVINIGSGVENRMYQVEPRTSESNKFDGSKCNNSLMFIFYAALSHKSHEKGHQVVVAIEKNDEPEPANQEAA